MARFLRGSTLRSPAEADALDEARRLREDAAREAERLVAEARARAGAIEAEAHARGLEAARLEQAVALAGAARARDGALAGARGEVAALAVAVARRLLGGELQLAPERIGALVDDALGRVRGATTVELRLHPDDARAWEAARRGPDAGTPTPTVVPDPTIERGGCLVRSNLGEVDARVATRADRLLAALAGDDGVSRTR